MLLPICWLLLLFFPCASSLFGLVPRLLIDACFFWTALSMEGLKAFEGVSSLACAVSTTEGWLESSLAEVGHTSSFSPSDCPGDVRLSLGSLAPEFSFIISGCPPSCVTRAGIWLLLAGGL